jgi:hypothetical protein
LAWPQEGRRRGSCGLFRSDAFGMRGGGGSKPQREAKLLSAEFAHDGDELKVFAAGGGAFVGVALGAFGAALVDVLINELVDVGVCAGCKRFIAERAHGGDALGGEAQNRAADVDGAGDFAAVLRLGAMLHAEDLPTPLACERQEVYLPARRLCAVLACRVNKSDSKGHQGRGTPC